VFSSNTKHAKAPSGFLSPIDNGKKFML